MNQLISSIADRANVLLVSNSPNDVRELLYVLDRHNLGTGLAGDIDEGVELAAGGTGRARRGVSKLLLVISNYRLLLLALM